jgi:hypothetical protein
MGLRSRTSGPRAGGRFKHPIDWFAVATPLALAALALLAGLQPRGAGGGANSLLGFAALLAIFSGAIATFRFPVRHPQDYYGGLALVAVALFAMWAASDLRVCADSISARAPRRGCSRPCC